MMRLHWPLPVGCTRITSHHGELVLGKPHVGIDISCEVGTPVYAAHNGTVRYEWTHDGGTVARVVGSDYYTRSCHLSSYTADDGEQVQRGEEIARSGNSGSATTGAHLHFEAHLPNGAAIDPLTVMEVPEMSKLALQFQTYPDWARDIVAQYWELPNGWVMALDPPVPDIFPRSHILGRSMRTPAGYASCDDWERHVLSMGAEGGCEYFEFNLPYYEARRGIVSAWQFINEPVIWNNQDAANYRDGLRAWIEPMHDAGYMGVGGVFARGNPQLRSVDPNCDFLEIMGPALDLCDYLAYHGYCRERFRADDLYEALRYRLIAKELVSLGFKDPEWFISECLLDNGGGRTDGFRDNPAYQPNVWPAYFNDLRAFDTEIKKDPQVKKAFIFISGAYEMWRSFEIDKNQAIDLGEYALHDIAPAAGPTQAEIEAAIGEAMQAHIIPLNPAAALEKKLAEQRMLPASSEFDVVIGGVTYRAQAARKAEERDKQYCAYCVVGDWGNVKTFERAN